MNNNHKPHSSGPCLVQIEWIQWKLFIIRFSEEDSYILSNGSERFTDYASLIQTVMNLFELLNKKLLQQ